MPPDPIFISLCFRTPFGSLGGILSEFDPVFLASLMIENFSKVDDIFELKDIDHYILGNVYNSNFGTNLINKIVKGSLLDNHISRTQISHGQITGLQILSEAIAYITGGKHIVMCQTLEHLSSASDYMPNRRLNIAMPQDGKQKKIDGLLKDVYYINDELGTTSQHAERIGIKHAISKEESDTWAKSSLSNAKHGVDRSFFTNEISPIPIPASDGSIKYLAMDQELMRRLPDDLSHQFPLYTPDGILSPESIAGSCDGSAIFIVSDEKGLKKTGLIPQAKVLSNKTHYDDLPDYIEGGVTCIHAALKAANLKLKDMDIFEIHEDTSITPLGIIKALKIDSSKVNRYGGALSLGNPISASGMRLIMSACSQMRESKSVKYALVHLSDPSGMSSTIILERAN